LIFNFALEGAIYAYI